MTDLRFNKSNPEPVPGATQLLGMAFLAGVEGWVKKKVPAIVSLRVTMHRRMSRGGLVYLQQMCPYIGPTPMEPGLAGRVGPVTSGIVGMAYREKKIIRTRPYPDVQLLLRDMKADMEITGDTRQIENVGLSYLAIPMLGTSDEVVTVLYADSKTANVFAQDDVVRDISEMCIGFCRFVDEIVSNPLRGFRNFPLEIGEPVVDKETVYPTVQEVLGACDTPRYLKVSSLNLEVRI